MNHAAYNVVAETDDSVFIEDLCGEPGYELSKSITNDAEQVVIDLLASHGNKKIIYRDTADEWDELQHNGYVFIGFGTFRGQLPENL